MAERTIVWTRTAVLQRREILKYWTVKNGTAKYARKLILLTNSRLKIILKNPFAFKLSTFSDMRVSALGHFSILYKVTDDKLIVTAFWDNRQDPKELLELLVKKN